MYCGVSAKNSCMFFYFLLLSSLAYLHAFSPHITQVLLFFQ